MVRSPLRAWAAAFTRTASVCRAVRSPLNERVSVAVAPPAAAVAEAMDRPGIPGATSAKPEAVTPPEKVVPSRVTVRVAVFRFPSVSPAGLVDETDAVHPAILCADWPASLTWLRSLNLGVLLGPGKEESKPGR